MGFISATHSVTRYHIEGDFDGSTMESVRDGLIKNAMPEIESEYDEILAGWTPFESPYKADFETYSFIYGTYFLFSLRIDKKNIPAKLVQKHMALEIEKKKKESGRDFLSKNEKSEIKDFVLDLLMHKIPSIPNTYDILWIYEEKSLYLFSTQKAANELFTTLFLKSFNLKPIRVFPYTMIEKLSRLTDTEKDQFLNLMPLTY